MRQIVIIKDVSESLLQKIIEKVISKKEVIDFDILVNTEEYNEILKNFDISSIKNHFSVINFSQILLLVYPNCTHQDLLL